MLDLGTAAPGTVVYGSFEPFVDSQGNPCAPTSLTATLYEADGQTSLASVSVSTSLNYRASYSFTVPSYTGRAYVIATGGTDASGRPVKGTCGGVLNIQPTANPQVDVATWVQNTPGALLSGPSGGLIQNNMPLSNYPKVSTATLQSLIVPVIQVASTSGIYGLSNGDYFIDTGTTWLGSPVYQCYSGGITLYLYWGGSRWTASAVAGSSPADYLNGFSTLDNTGAWTGYGIYAGGTLSLRVSWLLSMPTYAVEPLNVLPTYYTKPSGTTALQTSLPNAPTKILTTTDITNVQNVNGNAPGAAGGLSLQASSGTVKTDCIAALATVPSVPQQGPIWTSQSNTLSSVGSPAVAKVPGGPLAMVTINSSTGLPHYWLSSDNGYTWADKGAISAFVSCGATYQASGTIALPDGVTVIAMLSVQAASASTLGLTAYEDTNGLVDVIWSITGTYSSSTGLITWGSKVMLTAGPDATPAAGVTANDNNCGTNAPILYEGAVLWGFDSIVPGLTHSVVLWQAVQTGGSWATPTWTQRGVINPPTALSIDESPALFSLAGSLWAVVRNDAAYTSMLYESTDGGYTWSFVRNIAAGVTGSPSVTILASGLVAVKVRRRDSINPTVFFSRDLINWSSGTDQTYLNSGDSIGYGHGCQITPNLGLLVFVIGANEIEFISFTDDIASAALAGYDSGGGVAKQSGLSGLPAAVWNYLTSAVATAGSIGKFILGLTPTGPGGSSYTITVETTGGAPLQGVSTWITTDVGGNTVIAGPIQTNASGQVTFVLPVGTFYVWRQLANYTFTNPQAITVV